MEGKLKTLSAAETADRIQELQNKIVSVCMRCPHAKWVGGHFECDRKRSQCHSKRARRWLDEIKKLEEENGTRTSSKDSR